MTLWKEARAGEGVRPPTGVTAKKREISQVIGQRGRPRALSRNEAARRGCGRFFTTGGPMTEAPTLKTPLHALHVELGARMAPFAGYDMPIKYPTGVLAEHLHTRKAAGLFDVSHMGQALIEGADHARRRALSRIALPRRPSQPRARAASAIRNCSTRRRNRRRPHGHARRPARTGRSNSWSTPRARRSTSR